ncbi:2-amino-4-hydroxy-6-hydroxymethyldihydropteridine diphosphokinase [Angustibacter sp. Root456]|uniref:2-amino-4-hydroxy-6- hydroxymethyldihydropteridine diphosphokinase n=1 Tax=Angustibacter sp. Root456 TaxID=1736539 RepID=UPI0019102C20|nr:2-amino-4-hydroxy-6-hydroxymethyldihydropteridine diphosphokinase [Angustibacter sp. Root456]
MIPADAPATVAVVALGANLGEREAALRGALDALDVVDGVAVDAVSPVATTRPVGGSDQPDYLNAVALVRTGLAPDELLAVLNRVEAQFGRVRLERWGPRTLDLDLISYGVVQTGTEVVSDDPRLTLPHPRAHERAFVLVPWSQVQPDALLRTPGGAVRLVRELAEAAPDRADLEPADVGPLR